VSVNPYMLKRRSQEAELQQTDRMQRAIVCSGVSVLPYLMPSYIESGSGISFYKFIHYGLEKYNMRLLTFISAFRLICSDHSESAAYVFLLLRYSSSLEKISVGASAL